jgi:hypothetical protein
MPLCYMQAIQKHFEVAVSEVDRLKKELDQGELCVWHTHALLRSFH